MRAPLFILLFLALAAYGQQQERVAIINTVDDRDSISVSDLAFLTNKLRETAVNILPKSRYGVMTTESIVAFFESHERAVKECKEATCLADLGRRVSADYVAQAHIGRFGNQLSINFDLYKVASGNLIGSFAGYSKDIFGLLSIIKEEAPVLFKKMPGVSGGVQEVPSVAGGISGVQKTAAYEADDEKRYLVNLNTEPPGVALSFDGVPSCPKTPCKVELRGGSVRIIAALEQYETTDTTVSIKQNNQNITITLKPNFGILEIKPAYSDGIGKDKQWNLSINDKSYSFGEVRLSPNKYTVKLNHECYENIGFDVGINKGKREVFDMASNISLKKGGLALSAERNGEPVSEPVFVNGKQVGETPFNGSVPLCAKVEIGSDRQVVDVKLKHNDKVKHTHNFYKTVPSYTIQSMFTHPITPLDVIPFVGIYYQRIWDMHHLGFTYAMFYGSLGLNKNETDIEKKDESEFILGFIHRWVIIPDNFYKMSFGLFGGLGMRRIEYEYCTHFFDQCVQFESESYENLRHELGIEFILGHFSLFITERNFHRIGVGMGVVFWWNRDKQGFEW